MVPFTQKMMVGWGGRRKFVEGKSLFEQSVVSKVEFNYPYCSGKISHGERVVRTKFKLWPDGSVESMCPCYDSVERGVVCTHVIALGLALISQTRDPERERKAKEEERRAQRMEEFDESQYVQRVCDAAEGAVPACIGITLGAGWREGIRAGTVSVCCHVSAERDRWAVDEVPRGTVLQLSKKDEAVLFVLEDISEGPARGRIDVSMPDFINLLNLLKGESINEEESDQEIMVDLTCLESILNVDLDHENGELILRIHTEIPFMSGTEFPLYCVAGRSGWVYGANNFWPLENVLPPPLRHIYKDVVTVERASVPRFLDKELPALEKFMRVESEVGVDLFSIEPAVPKFCLRIKGSPASLAATMFAEYGDIRLIAGRDGADGSFALPDDEDLLRYYVRNISREESALLYLKEIGFGGEYGDALHPIVGCREVLNFMGRELPELKRQGWGIEMEGGISEHMEAASFAIPVVHVDSAGGSGWFEVRYEFTDSEGSSLSQAEIYTALQKGDSYVQKNNRITLLDARAIEDMGEVFRDCSRGEGRLPGSFRVPEVYAPYVKSSLDSLDGVDVEATRDWTIDAEAKNRKTGSAPVVLSEKLNKMLRPYQKEGINWLRSLEQCGFCGILADEMGLGKTVQTLAWLQAERLLPDARKKPSLVICPTSLVDNWAEEVRKFMPSVRVLLLTGTDRHERRDQLSQADIAISSYAIMRRDIEFYEEHEFGVLVLDEAQHIKNHSTQNAQAAKRILADNRMVLTGTPIENGVSDIWSIMDFLMPGYLGPHRKFRKTYELPIAAEGRDGEIAQRKLKRKLQPFILRRTKSRVAKDLPDKIERVAYCKMTGDQQKVYKELAESSRRRLNEMVGSNRDSGSRMEVLKLLLRLRQTCCHLDLLKNEELKSSYPSAKMDLFFELLDEAVDGGHRVLVFSQFVSMLTILRRELEEKEMRYCYLDGSTSNRLEIVKQFNTDSSIPVFLISLKAGGVGLNLTGADMVVHFDPWWNPAVEDQATDRAHRIGQKRTVYSVKLITKGTVEEKVVEMQQRKREIIDATLSEGGDMISKLTWEEIKSLLE